MPAISRASTTAIRAVANCSFGPRITARTLSRTRPLRSAGGSHGSTHKQSSDMPWLIGAVAFTLPASYYLLSSGSPKPQHSHPHEKMDTASTSPGDLPDTPPGHHGPLTTPEADTPYGDDTATKPSSSSKADKETSSARGVKDQAKEAAGKAGEKANELYDGAKEKYQDSKESLTGKAKATAAEAGDKVKDVKDNARETAESAKETAEKKTTSGSDEKTETSKNPAKTDPGYNDMKESKSMNEQSGKQRGISDGDTFHSIIHDERGQAISKKSEGTHDSSRLKGTVDVNRPAK